MRVCSAHKATERLLEILHGYEQDGPLVYITIAGRSNALSAVVDANTRYPVIACPPYSDRYAGMDVLSSLRLPSGIASSTCNPAIGQRQQSASPHRRYRNQRTSWS